MRVWYACYLWLDGFQQGEPMPATERIFHDGDLALAVRWQDEELVFAYGNTPKAWFWVQDL